MAKLITSSEDETCDSDVDNRIFRSKLKSRKQKTDCVSKWRREYLDTLGISFNGNAVEITDLFHRLKTSRSEFYDLSNLKQLKVPSVIDILLSKTKAVMEELNFDLSYMSHPDQGEIGYVDIANILQETQKVEEKIEELAWTFDTEQLKHKEKLMYYQWYSGITEFYRYWRRFIASIKIDEGLKLKAEYVDLLKRFSRICLLDPVHGAVERSTLICKETRTTSIPDIRYYKQGTCSRTLELNQTVLISSVTTTELNSPEYEDIQTDRFTLQNSFKNDADRQILGQHGGELLLEWSRSHFKPSVLGIISFKTHVIFTLMEMTYNHHKDIRVKGEIDTKICNTTISYTRPYDFLKKEDRNEVMEHLFWLGCLQNDFLVPV